MPIHSSAGTAMSTGSGSSSAAQRISQRIVTGIYSVGSTLQADGVLADLQHLSPAPTRAEVETALRELAAQAEPLVTVDGTVLPRPAGIPHPRRQQAPAPLPVDEQPTRTLALPDNPAPRTEIRYGW